VDFTNTLQTSNVKPTKRYGNQYIIIIFTIRWVPSVSTRATQDKELESERLTRRLFQPSYSISVMTPMSPYCRELQLPPQLHADALKNTDLHENKITITIQKGSDSKMKQLNHDFIAFIITHNCVTSPYSAAWTHCYRRQVGTSRGLEAYEKLGRQLDVVRAPETSSRLG
jgi:hypothetical protein